MDAADAVVKFALLKRRPDLDHAAFSRHWREVHAGVLVDAGHEEFHTSYVQNHFAPLDPDGDPEALPFDGGAQTVQRSPGNIAAGFQQDPRYFATVRPDELRFMDVARSAAFFTSSTVLRDGVDAGHKVLAFAVRREEVPAEDLTNRLAAWARELSDAGLPDAFAGFSVLRTIADGVRGPDADPAAHFDAVLEWRLREPDAVAIDVLRGVIADAEPVTVPFAVRAETFRVY